MPPGVPGSWRSSSRASGTRCAPEPTPACCSCSLRGRATATPAPATTDGELVPRPLAVPPLRRQPRAALALLRAAQAVEDLVGPVVRAQQEVALRDDPDVGIGVRLAALDQVGLLEHGDDRLEVLVEPQPGRLVAVHEPA